MKSTGEIVLDLMRETFGDTFAEYYNGDPEMIPTFNLPALIVAQNSDTTSEEVWGQDEVTDEIVVKVVLNKADDFTGDKIDPLNLTEKRIRDLIGAIGDDRHYEPRTVKAAIKQKLPSELIALTPSMTVEYALQPRLTSDPSNPLWTSEGRVTFGVTRSVLTPVGDEE